MGELFLKDPGLHIAVKSIGRDLREKRDSSSPSVFRQNKSLNYVLWKSSTTYINLESLSLRFITG